MKKLFIAAIAVFGLTFGAQAQGVTFGAKAGVNMSTISGDFTDNTKAKIGFHVGGVAEIMINEKFGVQPELLFSTQGAQADEGDFETKLNYINVPVMAKYFVIDNLSVEAGPQVGILVSAEDEDGDDLKDNVNGVDFGVNVGAGYKMESGLNFSLRYNVGLSNLNDFEGSDDFNQKNSVFQVSVGYMF